MDDFHRLLAHIALQAAADYGFALAGGYAVQAHGMLQRPSEDIDLFTSSVRDDFAEGVTKICDAYIEHDLAIKVDVNSPQFVRLTVSQPTTGRTSKVELAADLRSHPPITMEIASAQALTRTGHAPAPSRRPLCEQFGNNWHELRILTRVTLQLRQRTGHCHPLNCRVMTSIKTTRRLAERWWQWVASIPASRNPLVDETGEFAAEGQPDDVWFLAGTFGGGVKRQCSIPSDRPIFFPMFNIYRSTFLFLGARAPVCPQASGSAELNGTSLPVHEAKNQRKFTLNAVPRSPLDFEGKLAVRAWGLWGYLDPLSPGTYVLTFRGEERPGGFWVEAEYDQTVV